MKRSFRNHSQHIAMAVIVLMVSAIGVKLIFGAHADSIISVTAYGAVGNNQHDDTTAIKNAMAAAATNGGTILFPDGTYKITNEIIIPDAVTKVVLSSGTIIEQYSDYNALSKKGQVDPTIKYNITAGATQGSSTLTLDTTSGLSVGSWFFYAANDEMAPQKGSMHPGSLRQITAIQGNNITLDRPVERTLVSPPYGWLIKMAQPVEISGGVIEFANPLTSFHHDIELDAVMNPYVHNIELRNDGSTLIKFMLTEGGSLTNSYLHDAVDDEAGTRYHSGDHTGYGIEVQGGTRDLTITSTHVTRVRHAFTTNPAYPDRFSNLIFQLGEPDHINVTLNVDHTTSSGLDTHEVGHQINFINCTVSYPGDYYRQAIAAHQTPVGKEPGNGIEIRARDVTVTNLTIDHAADESILVPSPKPTPVPGTNLVTLPPWPLADAPVFDNITITNSEGKYPVDLNQPVIMRNFTINSSNVFGIINRSNVVGSQFSNGDIWLNAYPKSKLYFDQGSNTVWSNITSHGSSGTTPPPSTPPPTGGGTGSTPPGGGTGTAPDPPGTPVTTLPPAPKPTGKTIDLKPPSTIPVSKLKSVTYKIDDKVVCTTSKAPFTCDVSSANLTAGKHTVQTLAEDKNNHVTSYNQGITVAHKSNAPWWGVGVGVIVVLGVITAAQLHGGPRALLRRFLPAKQANNDDDGIVTPPPFS